MGKRIILRCPFCFSGDRLSGREKRQPMVILEEKDEHVFYICRKCDYRRTFKKSDIKE